MFWRVWESEWRKLKRSRVTIPVLLAPILIIVLQYLNFLLRYNSVIKPGDDPWNVFITQHATVWSILMLPLLSAILAGIVTSLEHSNNQWKYILTLPFDRSYLFMSKLLLILVFIIVSSSILGMGMLISGRFLQLPGDFQVIKLVETLGAAICGVFAVLTIQFWLSIRIHNPAIPLAIAVCGTILAVFFAQSAYTRWLPWVYPIYVLPIELNEHVTVVRYLIISVIVGLVFIVIGLRDFLRRDL